MIDIFCLVLCSALLNVSPYQEIRSRDEVLSSVQHGDALAVLELGRIGDPRDKQMLNDLARNGNQSFGTISGNAVMALARMGDTALLQQFKHELKSKQPHVVDCAIFKIAYVGTREAIQSLVPLLDHKAWRNMRNLDPSNEHRQDLVVYEPLAIMVMSRLAPELPDPPVPPTTRPSLEHIPLWKEYFRKKGYQVP